MTFNDDRLPSSFWARVRVNQQSGCWEWAGSKDHGGYGRFKAQGKTNSVHRMAYEALRATIPPGLQLDHLCRVRNCVNPAHLEPVTKQENVRRGLSAAGVPRPKGTHCQRGHEYTPENTQVGINKDGMARRSCRICVRVLVRDAMRRFRARRRQAQLEAA